jgi:hypothetical protein
VLCRVGEKLLTELVRGFFLGYSVNVTPGVRGNRGCVPGYFVLLCLSQIHDQHMLLLVVVWCGGYSNYCLIDSRKRAAMMVLFERTLRSIISYDCQLSHVAYLLIDQSRSSCAIGPFMFLYSTIPRSFL